MRGGRSGLGPLEGRARFSEWTLSGTMGPSRAGEANVAVSAVCASTLTPVPMLANWDTAGARTSSQR